MAVLPGAAAEVFHPPWTVATPESAAARILAATADESTWRSPGAAASAVAAQFDRLLDYVEEKLPEVFAHLDRARADLLAFTAFPKEIGTQIWSNNPTERLGKEIRRRTDSVGVFPDRDAIVRLVGAVLAEQTDEWAEGRRYLGLDVLARSRLNLVPTNDTEIGADDLPAVTAWPSSRRTQRYTTTRDLTSNISTREVDRGAGRERFISPVALLVVSDADQMALPADLMDAFLGQSPAGTNPVR